MPYSDKRNRHKAGLSRFASITPSRVLGERLRAEAVEADVEAAAPIQGVLELACMFHDSKQPDLDGRTRASLGPHPFVVLAWAREQLWGDRDNIDRDVAAWAVWTFCQIRERGEQGKPYILDLGDEQIRVTPEAHGIVAMTDVLRIPGLDVSFPGDADRRRVDVNTAIRRIEKVVEKQLRKAAESPDL